MIWNLYVFLHSPKAKDLELKTNIIGEDETWNRAWGVSLDLYVFKIVKKLSLPHKNQNTKHTE